MSLNARKLLILANLLLGLSARAAVSFSIDPATIGDNYLGNVTLNITGLNAGETVVVQKYLDANGNGVVDAGDWLVQQFPLTDGKASVIGGVTNINVAADLDSVAGRITANWNLHSSGLEQRFAGKYLFSVSSSGFSAVTVLTITNAVTAQRFTGSIQANGASVPGAAVLLFAGTVGSSSFVAGAVADNSGHYTVKAAPGTYSVVALKPGYVTDAGGAPVVTLNAGATISTNLDLLPPTQSISGRFVDAAVLGPGLGGMLVVCDSADGLLAIGTTDASGNYSIPVTASQWQVGWEDGVLPVLGYVDALNQPTVDTTAGNATGITVSFPKGTALLHGSLKNSQDQPIPGVNFFADDSSDTYEASGTTDSGGNYVTAVSAGTWYLSPDRTDPALSNYIVSEGTNVTLTAGQAVLQNFTALLATNQISGLVLDVSNNPVANLGIYGYATFNGVTYNQFVDTAADGSYSFSVAPGTWNVGLNCSGSSDSLSALQYECVNEVAVTVSGVNVTTNFTVRPCGQLQVTSASPVATGQVGLYYEVLLQAVGCNQPFTWTLAPGSQPLPGGLGLNSDGTLAGYPNVSGNFSFTVRLTDSAANHIDHTLSANIAPALLQVITATLPDGKIGSAYSQQFSATGGQPPFSWSLNPGSDNLPPGLNLSSGGLLTGTPTLSATFFFDIRVADALGSNAVQSLSLLVTNSVLSISTSSLPNAAVGLPYSAQLIVSGGQPPYSWDVATNSADLPSGLLLSSDGRISGTPDTAGLFNFVMQVTDANSVIATHPLSMVVDSGLLIGAPNWSSSTGEFRFQVQGSVGQIYVVEQSSDLNTWSPVQTTTPSTSLFTVTVPGATAKLGFYRLRLGP